MPVEELLKTPFKAHFVVDRYVLASSPFDAYKDGTQNDVDLLVGSNADEGQLFLAGKTTVSDEEPSGELTGAGGMADRGTQIAS